MIVAKAVLKITSHQSLANLCTYESEFHSKQAYSIEDTEDGDAGICEDGDPHIGEAQEAHDHDGDLHDEGEGDIFPRGLDDFSSHADGFGDGVDIRIQEDDVGCFDGSVCPAAHSSAYVSTGEDGGVIDAVTDEEDGADFFSDFLHFRKFVFREEASVDILDADEVADGFRALFIVPGQHDGGDGEGFQVFDAFDGVGLDGIGNGDAAEEGLAFGDVDVGADFFMFRKGRDGNTGFREEFFISDVDVFSFPLGFDAVAGDFLHGGEGRQGKAFFIRGAYDGLGDGVGGVDFTSGGEGEDLVFALLRGLHDASDFEFPFGQGAGLIEDSGFGIREGFHDGAALEEDAFFRSGTDAGEEGERDGDDERAGTADDEEGERGVDAFIPVSGKEERREDCDGDRDEDDDRGIHAGEAGDESVDLWLAGDGIFDGVEDAGDHGFREDFFDLDADGAGHIHAAGVYAVADGGEDGLRLAGDGGGVDLGLAFGNDAVKRYAVAGADEKDVADFGFFGRDGLGAACGHALDDFRTQVDGVHDLVTAAVGSEVLEVFTDAVEEHDTDGFRIFVDREGADGRNGHEEGLVEEFPMGDVFEGGVDDGAA